MCLINFNQSAYTTYRKFYRLYYKKKKRLQKMISDILGNSFNNKNVRFL